MDKRDCEQQVTGMRCFHAFKLEDTYVSVHYEFKRMNVSSFVHSFVCLCGIGHQIANPKFCDVHWMDCKLTCKLTNTGQLVVEWPLNERGSVLLQAKFTAKPKFVTFVRSLVCLFGQFDGQNQIAAS